jgi:hypothetical protein
MGIKCMQGDGMTTSVQPQWLAKMYPGKVGRDHLGLGSVSSDQILPSLSPGINVLTYHPRYFSLYVFLLDEFWQRDRPRSNQAWINFFRPREFIFSVGGHLPGHLSDRPEHGQMGKIVGGSITQGLALQEQPSYDTQTYYIKSPLGGYGLYYRSVMAELGLLYPGGRGLPYPVDVPSEKGKEVAAAFREAVKNTAYWRTYFDQDQAEIPIEVIREYVNRACLCQLQHTHAPDRPLLLDVFLHGGGRQAAVARRATFRLFLDIAQQTPGYPINQNIFRQLLFYQEGGNGAIYIPQEMVAETHRRWRLYQAREYYAFALNAMWDYFCLWGITQHGDLRPIRLTRFWQHLDDALDFAGLAARSQVAAPNLTPESSLQALLYWLTGLVGADESGFDACCDLSFPLNEHRLYRSAQANRDAPAVMVAGMVTILALIYLRFSQPELWLRPEWEIARMGSNGRLPMDRFIQQLRGRLRSGPVTIGEIVRGLYSDCIILQHQVIASGKLPDNTFRFRRQGDRLHFYNLPHSVDFMDSRFDALNASVHGLGLCGDLTLPEHPLTEDGRQLLVEGDLTWMH